MDTLENGDEEEAKEVFARFGLAIYQSQVLEESILATMLYARLPERDRVTRANIDEFITSQLERTLGQIMHELRRWITVPPELDERLRKALKRRNSLAHGYFREHAATWYLPDGSQRMIAELTEANALFEAVCVELDELVAALRDRFGITPASIDAHMTSMVTEAKQGAD